MTHLYDVKDDGTKPAPPTGSVHYITDYVWGARYVVREGNEAKVTIDISDDASAEQLLAALKMVTQDKGWREGSDDA